jgi:hypothetical protein
MPGWKLPKPSMAYVVDPVDSDILA